MPILREIASSFVLLLLLPLTTFAGGFDWIESEPTDVQMQDRPDALALSPDGKHLYVVGDDDFVTVWSRDLGSGQIAFVQKEEDGASEGMNTVDGLRRTTSVAVTADGTHVYVTGSIDNAVVVFDRDGGTGMLTWVGAKEDDAGDVPIHTMRRPSVVAVSPDDAHVYVGSDQDSAIAVFSRDAGTGELTFVEVQEQSPSSCNMGGVCGILHPAAMTFSSDAKTLYVAGQLGAKGKGSIAVFRRDADAMSPDFGKLTFVELKADDQPDGTQSLSLPTTLVLSPDGKHLYASCPPANSILIFTRDDDPMSPNLGTLTFLRQVRDGGTLNGIGEAWGLAIDSSGHYLFASGRDDAGIVLFRRDDDPASPHFGLLSFLDARFTKTNERISQPMQMVLSPDDRHLYTSITKAIVVLENDWCGNGSRGVDEQCDDGCDAGTPNVCEPADDGDGCSSQCRFEICGAVPMSGCTTIHTAPAEKAYLSIKNDVANDDAKDQLQWKWQKGTTGFAELGAPDTTSDYLICIYDSSGSAQPLASHAAPFGDTCRGKPCWKRSVDKNGDPKSFTYKDKGQTPDGLEQVQLKPGTGKAQVQVKGKGANLRPVTLPPGGLTLPVTVEVRRVDDPTVCWVATYDATPVAKRIIANDATKFKAKSN